MQVSDGLSLNPEMQDVQKVADEQVMHGLIHRAQVPFDCRKYPDLQVLQTVELEQLLQFAGHVIMHVVPTSVNPDRQLRQLFPKVHVLHGLTHLKQLLGFNR